MNICVSTMKNYKNVRFYSYCFHIFTSRHTSLYVQIFSKMSTCYLSAPSQLFIRSVSVKSEFPLSTLPDPFSGHADESENKAFHSWPQRNIRKYFWHLLDEMVIEVFHHRGHNQKHSIAIHIWCGKASPAKVVVLDIEQLFACSSHIEILDNFFFAWFFVIGQNRAIDEIISRK